MIIQSPSDATVQQGGSVVFHCKARGHPAPHIAWASGVNGDRPIPGEDRFGYLPSGALVIHHLNVTDEGLYRCVASNSAGSASGQATLKVNGEWCIWSLCGVGTAGKISDYQPGARGFNSPAWSRVELWVTFFRHTVRRATLRLGEGHH